MSDHHDCKYSKLTVCLFTLCIVINNKINVFVWQINNEMFMELKNNNHNNCYYYDYCYYLIEIK